MLYRCFIPGFLLSLVVSVTASAQQPEALIVHGLRNSAEIVRDSENIPHVFVSHERDAYFVLGYLHARDRFFQMDFFRHIFEGRLSELVGAGGLSSDAQFRSFDLEAAARRSLRLYSGEAQNLLEAYAAGVNAARQVHPLPLEYSLLELSGETLRPWEPWDAILMLKGFSVGSWMDLSDLDLTRALGAFQGAGQAQGFDGDRLFFEDIYRLAPIESAATVPQGSSRPGPPGGHFTSQASAGLSPATLSPATLSPAPGMAVAAVDAGILSLAGQLRDDISGNPWLRPALQGAARGQGSNWWIVAAEKSATGMPILANDPHQFLSMPPLVYLVHLVAGPSGKKMNLFGATFAGIPAVVSGCNDRLCWGATNNAMDLTDTFAEQVLVDENGRPTHTLFRGEAEPIEILEHEYRVNVFDGVADTLETAVVTTAQGAESYRIRRRNGGPLLALGPATEGVAQGLSVQYTGWSANRDLEAYVRLHRAENLSTFTKALDYADGFLFNMAYADRKGHIAYLTTGEMPLRDDLQNLERVDGLPPFLIRDGSGTFRNEWLPARRGRGSQSLGYEILPAAEMPSAVNPESGLLISSNNDPLGLTADNDPFNTRRRRGGILYLNRSYTSLRAFQSTRSLEVLTAGGGVVTEAAVRDLQGDVRLPDGEILTPFLLAAFDRASAPGAAAPLAVLAADGALQEAAARLGAWRFTAPTGITDGYDAGDDPAQLPEPSAEEIDESVAATLFSVWRGQAIRQIVDRPLVALGLEGALPPGRQAHVALIHLLRTLDTSTGEGASGVRFYEAPGLGNPADARDYLLLRALADSLELLRGPAFAAAFGQSTDLTDYRWGKLHRITIPHFLGGPFNAPPAGGFHDLAPGLPGLSKAGGFESMDTGPHDPRAADAGAFTFGLAAGARTYFLLGRQETQSFEIVPGGMTGDPTDPAYGGQLDRWLTNGYEEFVTDPSQVLQQAASRQRLVPARP